jgi:hypothetical protein
MGYVVPHKLVFDIIKINYVHVHAFIHTWGAKNLNGSFDGSPTVQKYINSSI